MNEEPFLLTIAGILDGPPDKSLKSAVTHDAAFE